MPLLVGDKIVVATTSQNCSVISAEIPHDSAEKSIDQLMRAGDAAMLVSPGSSVAIAVDTDVAVDQEEIKASLTEAATKAGWSVSEKIGMSVLKDG